MPGNSRPVAVSFNEPIQVKRKTMKKIITRSCALAGILFAATMAVSQAGNLKNIEITDEFPWERCADSVGLINSCLGADCNPYLPLIVGRVQELDNSECDDCEEFEAVAVSMLADTETVNGHATRVMEEREWVGEFGEEPELAEVSRNFVIMCPNTQDVFYFGEDVCLNAEDEDALEAPLYGGHYNCEADGMLYGTGAWRAGLGDDEPGLLFPGGTFLLNAAYFQELASVAVGFGRLGLGHECGSRIVRSWVRGLRHGVGPEPAGRPKEQGRR
jgi:hypothetical protein